MQRRKRRENENRRREMKWKNVVREGRKEKE